MVLRILAYLHNLQVLCPQVFRLQALQTVLVHSKFFGPRGDVFTDLIQVNSGSVPYVVEIREIVGTMHDVVGS